MSVHSEFILTPLSNILDEVGVLTQNMGGGIEMYPMWDYIMQSVFIKMTGAQEQKMKCVCWEIATVDFEIRRNIFFPWGLGECSTLKDKREVLKCLMKGIRKFDRKFDADIVLREEDVWDSTKSFLENFHERLKRVGIYEREYNEYEEIFNMISSDCVDIDTFYKNCDNCLRHKKSNNPSVCLKKKNLTHMYQLLYDHRNRCAHNLSSYQQNLPSLDTLYDDDYVYKNYFIRFALLIIIDKIVVALYKVFQDKTEGFFVR